MILALCATAAIFGTFAVAACVLAGRADDAQPTIEQILQAEALRAVAEHDRGR